MSFLNFIQTRSDGALGSSRIMRASISEAKRQQQKSQLLKLNKMNLLQTELKTW